MRGVTLFTNGELCHLFGYSRNRMSHIIYQKGVKPAYTMENSRNIYDINEFVQKAPFALKRLKKRGLPVPKGIVQQKVVKPAHKGLYERMKEELGLTGTTNL